MAGFLNPKQRSVDAQRFAMIPRPDVPRSVFSRPQGHKTSFNAGYLVPVFCDEVYPGDTHQVRMTAFARLATPIYPLMDNMWLESFFFFVPNRLVWRNWQKLMGEEETPGASISYLTPVLNAPGIPANGFAVGSLMDYFGLPVEGQITAGQGTNMPPINALPFRAYNQVFYDWFRDENFSSGGMYGGLLPSAAGDGPDDPAAYVLLRRGKRHDYFTSCLPWPQKGTAVSLPLGTSAPIATGNTLTALGVLVPGVGQKLLNNAGVNNIQASASTGGAALYADLSQATSATINQLRESFMIQALLERNARGGSRYSEIFRAHFGVVSPDARLQRAEYLGGGKTPVMINPVAQTSASTGTQAVGDLAATGTALAEGHGFSQSFTEHGFIIGIVNVRADMTYQQGIHKMWSRRTRYDYYWPAFAHLGEQAVMRQELYWKSSTDTGVVFGYQERWSELRYGASKVTGVLRSGVSGTLDAWHLAQNFGSAPLLDATFIEENPPVSRVVAVPSEPQFIADMYFDVKSTRPMPVYSVPGLTDRF